MDAVSSISKFWSDSFPGMDSRFVCVILAVDAQVARATKATGTRNFISNARDSMGRLDYNDEALDTGKWNDKLVDRRGRIQQN